MPFLREFQTIALSLASFLYNSLFILLKNLLQRIIKKNVLEKTSLPKIALDKDENLLRAKEVDTGFYIRYALRTCSKVSDKDILQFMCMQKVLKSVCNEDYGEVSL